MPYDAVLFDSDGVVVEPTDRAVLHSAAREAFADLGVEKPDDEHVESVVTGVTVEELERICDTYGVDAARFWERREHHASRVQRSEIREGRKALYDDVEAAIATGHDCGIVSNNQHRTIEFVVEHFGLEDRFGTYYGREPAVDGLRRKKPEPHYIEAALADLGAEHALYVGDSESDVIAADRAGLDSAFVRRDHRAGLELGVEPTYEVESLAALPDLLD